MATYSFEQFMKLGGATKPEDVRSIGINTVTETPKEEGSISKAFKSSIEKAKAGYTQAKEASNPLELIEGGIKLAAGAVSAPFAPLAPLTKPIEKGVDFVADKVSDIPAVQEFAGSKAGEITSRVAEDVADLSTIAGTAGGIKATPKITNKVIQKTTPAIKGATDKVFTAGTKVLPKTPEIMNRVARLTPKQANSFKDLAGKSHGEYLAETGNFGTPDKIIANEATKFTQSLKSVDDAFAELPGVYKDGSIADALTELNKKALAESGDNVKAPYLPRVQELTKKFSDDGLDMTEINEVKRLLERNVKLGYNKLTNAEKVVQATNIDDALRKWQAQKAKDLGFKNVEELNKQTQLSKFIINNLGDQVVGKTGLNGVNLTDWIVLSGGDPTAVASFLTKKFFSSKSIQSKIAEMLNKGDIKAQIKADLKPTAENLKRKVSPKGLEQLPAGTSKTIENRVPIKLGGKSSIEKPATKIYREPTLVENQILLPERAGAIKLPESVTELRKLANQIKTGISEVKNANIKNPADRRKVIKLIEDRITRSKRK
jgi:hypothetical protein